MTCSSATIAVRVSLSGYVDHSAPFPTAGVSVSLPPTMNPSRLTPLRSDQERMEKGA
jgi:hypothetical protein